MKITRVRLFRYRLPLKKPITIIHGTHDHREGIIVELQKQSGIVTYGEAAPLPGFSREDIAQVETELLKVSSFLTKDDLPPDLDVLDGAFESWLGPLAPSVRFALESAIVEMIALEKGVSLGEVLGAGPPANVKINALLTGSNDEILTKASSAASSGFTSVKLKVGHLSVSDAYNLVREVKQRLGDKVSLRLDANRAFSIADALDLVRRLREFEIEYIEEPAANLNQLRKLISEVGESARVALDESLREIRPEDLSLGYQIKAIVIKPTMLGLDKSIRFARNAIANNIVAVISSSYETSVGIRALASIAAAITPDVPAGLDTIESLTDDLIESPVKIENGRIDGITLRQPLSALRFDLLEEITHD